MPPERFFISFSPGFNRVIRGLSICQYHLRKRVGQTVERHFSKTRTHPLTQVVLTAPANPKPLKRFEDQKANFGHPVETG
jgi:hypothetical protein